MSLVLGISSVILNYIAYSVFVVGINIVNVTVLTQSDSERARTLASAPIISWLLDQSILIDPITLSDAMALSNAVSPSNRAWQSAFENQQNDLQISGTVSSSDRALQNAFENQQSDLQLGGTGTVTRILADDLKGSRHQRFILELATGQTLLVAHNIDIAPRIDSLRLGDRVRFYGEYEWNRNGGVIHWTHRNPNINGSHQSGWLRHNGRTYY